MQRHRQLAERWKLAQSSQRCASVPHLHCLQTLAQQQEAPPEVSIFLFPPGGGADAARQYQCNRSSLLQWLQQFFPGGSTVIFRREKGGKILPSNCGPIPPLFLIQNANGEFGRFLFRVRQ